ncbi:MAG TPA: hypothetical protein VHO24_02940 [Opitutaceae bacterium]|nr:hypothetical protein [Opitutaceae bacterium]
MLPDVSPSTSLSRSSAKGAPLRIGICLVYVLFATLVFWAHGNEPTLSIDHIAYFKLADEIAAANPGGSYWKEITSVRTYGVLLAYLHDFTGNHVVSLKWLLWGMTIAYLLSAEYWLASFTKRRGLAVAVALVSAMHVSFGTVFWGMTDFSASLNRSLAIPPMLLVLGWYFRRHPSPHRFLIYPILIYLSLLHLGTYYLLALVLALDGLNIAYTTFKTRKILWPVVRVYTTAIVLTGVAYLSLSVAGLNSTSLASLVPQMAPSSKSVVAVSGEPKQSGGTPGKIAPGEEASWEKPGGVVKPPTPKKVLKKSVNLQEALEAPPWKNALTSDEAWQMEIEAQPWRNFPPPLATLLGASGSLFFLVSIAIFFGVRLVRPAGWKAPDTQMLVFAVIVLFASYGLQSTLWVLRKFLPLYPMNFEEVRMVSFLMLPLMYFCLRGLDLLWTGTGTRAGNRRAAIAAFALLVVQPIHLVRLLPTAVRESIYAGAQSVGWLDAYPSQRNSYAREYLRLASNQERLYYPIQPVLRWLEANTDPSDRVLTNRDDLYVLPARVVGTSNGFLNTSSASLQRIGWSAIRGRLSDAIGNRDLQAIIALGAECSARFAVVPWKVSGARFTTDNFSIICVLDYTTHEGKTSNSNAR